MIEDTLLEEELLDEFKGGTLSINNSENKLQAASTDKLIRSDTNQSTGTGDSSSSSTTNKQRNDNNWGTNFITPFASIQNKLSTSLWNKSKENNPSSASASVNNEYSIQQKICLTENPTNFFTFRESVLARAMTECKEQFLDEESDGPLIEAFLLTQISHWNSDKERLLLLTTQSLVIAKYDFIALKRLGYKKLPLDMIDEIVIGELIYPSGSLIPNRNMKGIRIVWNKNQPLNFGSQWNPFTEDLPFCTFTYHPLYFHKDCVDEKLKSLYSLDTFIEKLSLVLAELPRNISPNSIPCAIQEKQDIILQSYVGIGSVIHNRNSLGFFKVRGKFSF